MIEKKFSPVSEIKAGTLGEPRQLFSEYLLL